MGKVLIVRDNNHKLVLGYGFQQIKQLPLEMDAKVEVDGEYHNVIEIRDRKAAVVESDCPGEDCVHSGWTGTPGRSVVCLPNRVEIRIVGMDSDVDFVVR